MCHYKLRALKLMLFAASSAIAQNALAQLPDVELQDKSLPYRQFDKVEITGSSIVRKEQTQTLPIQLITRSDIKNSGAQNTSELIQKLPIMFGYSEPGQLGLSRGSYSSAALHGMVTGTLVLINGKRHAPYGRQSISGDERSTVDMEFLPLSAIDRIELLTDGASSLYGTDAIAGVVNIITRHERQGFEVSTAVSLPDGMKGKGQGLDIAWGTGSLRRDGFSWVASLELERREQLLGADRPYVSEGRQSFQHQGKSYFVDGSALTALQSGAPTLAAGLSSPYGGHLWNALYQDGHCPNRQVQAAGQPACLYNPYPEFGLYPQMDIQRLYTKGSFQLGDSTVVFAEAGYTDKSQYKNYSVWPVTYGVVGTSPTSPGYDLAVANGFTPGRTLVMYRPTELGTLGREYSDQSYRVALGVKGEWGDWTYNSTLYETQSTSAYAFEYAEPYGANAGVLGTTSRLYSLLSDNPPTQVLRDYFLGRKTFKTAEKGRAQIQVLDVGASRTLFEMDGEPVLLGLGAEWRRQRDQFDHVDDSAGSHPDYRAQRQIFAQYVEVQWPLAQQLEVITALRNDHYSDFGNTTNGKISAKWQVNDALMLRGSMGTGFRAPALGQMQETDPYSPAFVAVTCNSALNRMATQLGLAGTCSSDGRLPIFTTGSSHLKPELSRQINWGLQFKPSAQHIWSLDYWRIQMQDTLRQFSSALVLSDPGRYASYYSAKYNRLVMDLPIVNLGQSKKSGVDFAWAYRQPTEWGRFYAQMKGTRFLKSEQSLSPELESTSDLGRYATSSGQVTPKMRTQWIAGLTQGDWNVQTTLNHVSGYTDADVMAIDAQTLEQVNVQGRQVPAFWTLDFSGTYQATNAVVLQARVLNVLNKQAPLSFTQTTSTLNAFNTVYSNLWGRVIQLGMTVKF